MIKEYFTDGLIQIAIIISLLRVDLHMYMDTVVHQEVQDLLQGPTSAFTQTRFHHHNWNRDVGAFVHPKHVDNHINELFRDIHALGRHRHLNTLNTRIEAYLVNDPHAQNLPSENANLSDESATTSDNPANHSNNASAPTTTSTSNRSSDSRTENALKEERSLPLGTELTKEDMDLIDVLWRQDMDLGVGREVFDGNLRRELEKERELELEKQKQQETELNKQAEQREAESNITFTVDNETGELIPAQIEEEDAAVNERDVQEAMQLITQQIQQEVPMEQQQQQQQQQPNFDQMNFSRQNSFEQRWTDVAHLLNIQPNTTVTDNVPQNALLQNASLAMQPNTTDFNINPIPIVPSNDTASFEPFNNATGVRNGTLFNLDSQGFVEPPGLFNNTADSLLQELLDDEDLNTLDFTALDLNHTEDDVKMDDVSSDSAVGSMTGSCSPVNMNDSMSEISSYHGIEGATGGDTKPKHELYESNSYEYSDSDSESSFSNDTDYKAPGLAANPRHVSHNHSYPLQPGQQPRERKPTAEERRLANRLSRDEKRAVALKLPFSVSDIIDSPVEMFNEFMQKHTLNDAQQQLVRDIRRRGKNKVAAQNCRKRKLEIIQSLEDDVTGIRSERDRLLRERSRLMKDMNSMKDRYQNIYKEVFGSLRDDNGHPYDPNEYVLQQTADGNVFLMPANSTVPTQEHKTKPSHKRKGKKGSR